MSTARTNLAYQLNNVKVNGMWRLHMSENKGEENAAYPPPMLPRRPERPEERRWPSPTPLPLVTEEDVGKVLKQILDRLDAIEKRLEKIENMLTQKQPIT